MRIHRAHDGRTIEVQQNLSNFRSIDDLLDSISLATAIPADGIICMSAEGVQLSDDLLATLSAQTDASSSHLIDFFVFSRDYLYADVDTVAQELAESPNLARPIEPIDIIRPPTPRSLEALVAWTHQVLEAIHSHASTSRAHHAALCTIQRSTSVALLNLISHSGTVQSNGLSMKQSNDAELGRMAKLLEGYQRDFEILGLVNVHPRLANSSSNGSRDSASGPASASANGSSSSSSKRTLADYVSRVKMGAVADACFKVHAELRSRLDELQGNADQLDADTLDVRQDIEGFSISPSTETLDEAMRNQERAEELGTFLINTCAPDDNGWPVADKLRDDSLDEVVSAVEELKVLEEASREHVRRLTADKNDVIARSLAHLGDISSLQSDYADLAASMAAFQGELTSSRVDGFRHLARLSNMLWAYGATVVETVRRREFTRHFLTKSQALAELMAEVSARERKRRGKYRTDVAGQLPWEVKGMDEVPPSLEISTTKTTGLTPELERSDIDQLLQLIDEIETTLAKADQISGTSSEAAHLAQLKEALRQLVRRLDMMDEEFAILVEEDLLGERDEDEDDDDEGDARSDGSLAVTKKRARQRSGTVEYERKEKERLQNEVQELMRQMDQREKADLERHHNDLAALRSESSTARAESRRLRDELDKEKHDAAAAKAELEALKNDIDTERERRINMQDELANLRKEALAARKESDEVRREAVEEGERAADLESQLHDVQAELEEARAARTDASNRIENLLCEGSNVERELSAAQERIEDLQQQLEHSRQEAREAREAHAEAETARERAVRSYRAEADSDRAILEESLREREAEVAAARQELERLKESTKVEVDAAQMLRSQIRGADEAHEELVKAMEAAKDGCAEAEFGKRHAEREREQLHDLIKPLLQSFIDLEEHVQSLPALSSSRQPSTSGPSGKQDGSADVPTSAIVKETNALRREALATFASFAAEGKADIDTTLAALRLLSPHSTADEVKKKLDVLVTLVRKWQKTFKRHSSEATNRLALATRERIAFRNFQVGDLALFLPSRNNVLHPKPWAAFNISCPHFFLNAPAGSVLAEQLRHKEWIVARIVAIVEKTTDESVEGGNPFQLPEGTKYCLLDVDGWNPNSTVASTASAATTATRPSKSRQVSRSSKAALAEVAEHETSDRREASAGSTVDASVDKGSPLEMEPGQGATAVTKGAADGSQDSTAVSAPLETPGLATAEAVLAATGATPQQVSDTTMSVPERGRKDVTDLATSPTSASASPSALTRALLASRSTSRSRPLSEADPSSRLDSSFATAPAGSVSSTFTAPAGSALPARESDGTTAVSRSATEHSGGDAGSSVSGTSGSRSIPAPAFGVRNSRRRAFLRTGSHNASAATSPGAIAVSSQREGGAHASASMGGRIADLTFEAMGNPFSQSPGAAALGSSMPRAAAAAAAAARAATSDKAVDASSSSNGGVNTGNGVSHASPTPAAQGKRRAPSSSSSATSPPLPSLLRPHAASTSAGSTTGGFAFTRRPGPTSSSAGSTGGPTSPSQLTTSGSVVNLTSTPVLPPSADFSSAHGETISHARSSSGVGAGLGGAGASSSSFSHFSNGSGGGGGREGSGFSTSTMGGVDGSQRSPATGKAAQPLPRSPSFLSRTFGRKMSNASSAAAGGTGGDLRGSRRFPSSTSVQSIFAPQQQGMGGGGNVSGSGSVEEEGNASASQLLRRLSERQPQQQQQGMSPP